MKRNTRKSPPKENNFSVKDKTADPKSVLYSYSTVSTVNCWLSERSE